MKEMIFGSARLTSVMADVGMTVLRVFAGLSLALAHGLGKLPPQPGFVQGIEGLGLPGWSAWLSGIAETFGGLGLAAGLATRLVSLGIVGNLSVAAFGRHAADPYARAELAYIFLAVAVMFLLAGGGRFALDRLIVKAR
jgi:putative oxidoreductase